MPNTFACPYAQSIPYTVKASIDFEKYGVTVDTPVVYFGRGPEFALKNLIDYGKGINRSRRTYKRLLV